jgi:predicted Rdx family selenoprotein
MAGEALNRVGESIESFKLVPSEHGKFHVSIDGELVAWHRHEPDAHIFPDLQDMMKEINARIGA